ncbi:MAG: hypothetical protein ACI9R3_001036 [Verrucomicrobiales bacterium]|jgi:hypothetical protein
MQNSCSIIWIWATLAAFGASAFSAELRITKPGKHNLTGDLTLQVSSHRDPDGLTRNKLTVIATDSDGHFVIEDHCALSFGENTLGVLATSNTDGALVTLADHWSVQTYQFYAHAERNRFRFESAGFDDEARWSMDTPKLQVWLLANKPDEITMVRPTVSRSAVNRKCLGRFVELGERLLGEDEILAAGYSTAGVLRANFDIKGVENRKNYRKLCEKYKGRDAAFIYHGKAAEVFTLNPDLKTFRFRTL